MITDLAVSVLCREFGGHIGWAVAASSMAVNLAR